METPSLVATVRGTSFNVSYTGISHDVYVSRHAVDVTLRSSMSGSQTVTAGRILRVREEHLIQDIGSGASILPQNKKKRMDRL